MPDPTRRPPRSRGGPRGEPRSRPRVAPDRRTTRVLGVEAAQAPERAHAGRGRVGAARHLEAPLFDRRVGCPRPRPPRPAGSHQAHLGELCLLGGLADAARPHRVPCHRLLVHEERHAGCLRLDGVDLARRPRIAVEIADARGRRRARSRPAPSAARPRAPRSVAGFGAEQPRRAPPRPGTTLATSATTSSTSASASCRSSSTTSTGAEAAQAVSRRAMVRPGPPRSEHRTARA